MEVLEVYKQKKKKWKGCKKIQLLAQILKVFGEKWALGILDKPWTLDRFHLLVQDSFGFTFFSYNVFVCWFEAES